MYNIAFSAAFMSGKRVVGDNLADSYINTVFADDELKSGLRASLSSLQTNADNLNLNAPFPDQQIFLNSQTLPAWADKKLMFNGASFFVNHAEPIMNLLGLLSLPYCYAAANGAMVLQLSERMKTDTEKRLLETAEFVWDVMSPEAFSPAGKGFASILKVRLMHAAARFYTLKSEAWNTDLGFPINQEDMAGTNLSFSLIVIRGLRKLGFSISHAQQQAFLHLWNVIGFLLGLDEILLPSTAKEAAQLEESIRLRQFKMSDHGRQLTSSLTQYFKKASINGPVSSKEILQLMRYLLGKEIADILDISPNEFTPNQIRLLMLKNSLSINTSNKNIRLSYRDEYQKFHRNIKLQMNEKS